MKKYKFFCILIILLTVYFLSAGYALFEGSMSISNVASVVRLEENIRVSSFAYSSSTNSGESTYTDYSLTLLTTNISLPNSNSTITYEVTITNYGNTEMGIYELTGLPSNLTYETSDYELHDKICNSSGECTLGASKTFYLTIKYTSSGYDSSNTNYSLNIDVDFRTFYTVTYKDITNNGYPTEVISGGNLVVTFTSEVSAVPWLYVDGTKLSSTSYSYSNYVLTYNNVTGNVTIISRVVSSIAVTTPPTTTTYHATDNFNKAGMVVTATYTDGSKEVVTNYSIVSGTNLANDQTYVTISYTENGVTKITTQAITVIVHVLSTGEIVDSWSVVGAATYVKYYSIGNWKSFTNTSGTTITMEIVGFGVDYCQDGTYAPITWVQKDITYTGAMSSSTTLPNYGWANSLIRARLQSGGDIYNGIPTEIMNIIKTARKYYYYASWGGTNTEFVKLWIPSYREIFDGTSVDSAGPTYNSHFSTNTLRVKYKNGTAYSWYLRSVNPFDNGFWYVNTQGNPGTDLPNYTYGIVIGFCT